MRSLLGSPPGPARAIRVRVPFVSVPLSVLVLADIWRELRQLCYEVNDTLMLVGSEIWMADLSFYKTVKQAARRDVGGADTLYDDLKQRVPGVSGDDEDEEDPAPTP